MCHNNFVYFPDVLQLDSLQSEADNLSEARPEEAEQIRLKIVQITEVWQELKMMVRSSTHSMVYECSAQLMFSNFYRCVAHLITEFSS